MFIILFSIITLIFLLTICIIQITIRLLSSEGLSGNLSNKYKLSIMAIFKNEEEYLEEWILHHINQGVSHLYLYSNDPEMNKYPYLSKYANWITLIPWVEKQNNGIDDTIQKQAYRHCVESYSGDS